MPREPCHLVEQGFSQGSCAVSSPDGVRSACRATLRWKKGTPYRLIHSAHLSRPEHYFSVYQSGCNLSCRKCHSWRFTRHAEGEWMSPRDIVALAEQYGEEVTVFEPRERATSFHALDLCRGCGTCVQIQFVPLEGGQSLGAVLSPTGKRSSFCPARVSPEQISLSPQGLGPARNIIAFTGGDLMCRPDFYVRSAAGIKELGRDLWVLLETNGYGLTPQNLDRYQAEGVDAFWLDIKAFDPEVHRRLTGVGNEGILLLPEALRKRGFILEVLTLFIPGWVERDQIGKIARLVADVDPYIPFTILAFFAEHKLKDVPAPNLDQMLSAYEEARTAGLQKTRLGNLGVFVHGEEDMKRLMAAAPEAI